PKVERIAHSLEKAHQLEKVVLAAPTLRMPDRADPTFQVAYDALDTPRKQAYDALQPLREEEAEIWRTAEQLQDHWKRRMTRTKYGRADNERTPLLREISLGIAPVVLGIIVTAWVAVTLRPLRRLREAARRIAAGDYGKRIPESGPAEISDLAREFNSMG